MSEISGTYAMADQDQIISSIKTELGLEYSDHDIWLGKLINEAVRHLDCLSVFQYCQARLEVHNNVAILPCGFNRILGLSIGFCNCPNAIYLDVPFINSFCNSNLGAASGVNSLLGAYRIQNDKIVFEPRLFFNACDPNATQPEPITECTIAFLGFNVDENGLLKVYSDMERALTCYACWKFTRRFFREYPRYISDGFAREWGGQKKWIRGIQFQNNFRDTRRQVAEWANCLIADKRWLP